MHLPGLGVLVRIADGLSYKPGLLPTAEYLRHCHDHFVRNIVPLGAVLPQVGL
jgi:hypothetical protein